MFSADGFFRIPTKPPAKSARQVRVEEEGGVVLSLATLAFVGAGRTWAVAPRVFLRANPRRNDTSNLIAPVNRARQNVHLSAF